MLACHEEKIRKEEIRKEEIRKEEIRKEEIRKEEIRKEEIRKEELRKEELRKEELRKKDFLKKDFLSTGPGSGNILFYEQKTPNNSTALSNFEKLALKIERTQQDETLSLKRKHEDEKESLEQERKRIFKTPPEEEKSSKHSSIRDRLGPLLTEGNTSHIDWRKLKNYEGPYGKTKCRNETKRGIGSCFHGDSCKFLHDSDE